MISLSLSLSFGNIVEDTPKIPQSEDHEDSNAWAFNLSWRGLVVSPVVRMPCDAEAERAERFERRLSFREDQTRNRRGSEPGSGISARCPPAEGRGRFNLSVAPREYFWGPVARFTARKPRSKISSWPNALVVRAVERPRVVANGQAGEGRAGGRENEAGRGGGEEEREEF